MQVISNEGSAGIRVVEKFLGILQFVVKESDVSFRKFIDSTLNLCLDYIYPLIANVPNSDLKSPLFTVLSNVLLYNWRHFFKSSVMRSLIGAPSPMPSNDQVHFLKDTQLLAQACRVLMHKLSADKKGGRYCMTRFFLRGYLRSGRSGSK